MVAVTGEVTEAAALRWLRALLEEAEAGREVGCAVCVADQRVGYVLLEIHDNQEGLLHYGLIQGHRGRGTATGACAALAAHAFGAPGLKALKIHPFADSVASCRVAERVGSARVGAIHIEGAGRSREIARYRLTAEQWHAVQGYREDH